MPGLIAASVWIQVLNDPVFSPVGSLNSSERKRSLLLTTPNERALRHLVGRDESIYEVIEGTDDVDAIVQAVREAARARPTK